MSTDNTAERVAIRAAMHRLLAGQPTNSTGALTVLQLAAEAGVKRWVLTHKHPDLRKEFEEHATRSTESRRHSNTYGHKWSISKPTTNGFAQRKPNSPKWSRPTPR